MSVIQYDDSDLESSIVAATHQDDECALAIGAFSSDVTVKLYGSGTHRATVTLAAFAMAYTEPRELTNGAALPWSFVSAGAVDQARLFDGSIARFRCPLTIGSIKSECAPDLTDYPLFKANSGKPLASSGGGSGFARGIADSEIALVGRFRVPPAVVGVNMTWAVPTICIGTEGSSPTLYVVGTKSGHYAYGEATNVRIAEIAVPATLSTSSTWADLPEATGIQATSDALEGEELNVAVPSAMYPDSPGGTPTLHTRIHYLTQEWTVGVLKVGSDLLMQQAIYYPGGAGITFEQATLFRRPANLSITGSISGPYALAGAGKRQTPGSMAKIPTSLQTAYGWKPVVTSGCAGLANNQDLCNGPGFVLFDPADLTGPALTTKATQIGAMYNYPGQTFAEANGGIFPAGESLTGAAGEHNGFYEMPFKMLGGVNIMADRGIAVYVGFKNTTAPWYGDGNAPPSFAVADPTNPTGHAPHGYPYKSYLQVINLEKFKAVIDSGGSIAPHTVTGNNQILLPDPPFMVPDTSGGGAHQAPTQNFFPCGSAYDATTRRLYVSYNGPTGVAGADGRTFIDVYQVAA